jgi:hypothetical protein
MSHPGVAIPLHESSQVGIGAPAHRQRYGVAYRLSVPSIRRSLMLQKAAPLRRAGVGDAIQVLKWVEHAAKLLTAAQSRDCEEIRAATIQRAAAFPRGDGVMASAHISKWRASQCDATLSPLRVQSAQPNPGLAHGFLFEAIMSSPCILMVRLSSWQQASHFKI